MSLQPREWPENAPSVTSRLVTLIAKNGRDLVWAVNIGEKRDLLIATRGPLWAVWTGEYSSHLFAVPRKQALQELGVAA